MADDNNTNDAQAHDQPPQPNPDLKSLDRLVGTWSDDGDTCSGEWVYPGGGGYESTMTRAK